ncbi:MAG: biotin carboxylase N-terminal domain-containing protein [bacterium]
MEINKILIANRGEIALRIIRTCHEMGIKTVALCPLPGQESNFLETSLADEFYYLDQEGVLGYLNQEKIIEIAKRARVDAIHPGYGFLAENWKFAKFCQKNKIKFIGPFFKVLKKFEDKIEAKKIARKIGIPILPSSDGPINNKKDLVKWIERIRPPFILKAQKGGGGIGMRVIEGDIGIGDVFASCLDIKRQIGTAFSETDFFLEKYLPDPRHIEFQILGDGRNVVHLGERDCTIQRRNQKLLEEAPSSFLTEEEREKLGRLAVSLGRYVKYEGAATVEFLLDEEKNFYFLEVNPRIQVEHPVTEAITGVDIVEQQIKIARGERLNFTQEDISFRGWAIEARINSESPKDNFRPQAGTIQKYVTPGGQHVFLHSFCQSGQEVYPYFDSLLAKLIVWGKDRNEAISRLKRALDEFVIEGVSTTIPFFKALLKNKDFLQGNFNTNFIEKSGILDELRRAKEIEKPKIIEVLKVEEEEVAKIVFDIYQNLKKEETQKSGKDYDCPSNWLMAERMQMLEDNK